MMPDQPKATGKLFYTIGEVAKMFEVNTSLIRYYEQEFEVIRPHKNKKGNRLFTQKDLEYFTAIFGLIRTNGFSLSEAREAIAKGIHPKKPDTQEEVIQRLRHLRKLLEELDHNLKTDQ